MSGVEGLIIKAVSGFYTVETGKGAFVCKARGIFRAREMSPLVGDRVRLEPEEDGTGWIVEILPRKNQFTRPPLSNVDVLAIVISVAAPRPNLRVTDLTVASAELVHAEPWIVINKRDLGNPEDFVNIYENAGFTVFTVSAEQNEGVDALRESLSKPGHISAFCGNSGVGKSSLLNVLVPGVGAATGEISDSLGRGRHTTRHTELFVLPGGGYLADTPGFSSLDFFADAAAQDTDMALLFREFAPYVEHCRYTSCAHGREEGCAVRAAVEAGAIAKSRYESYLFLREEGRKWEKSRYR